MKLFSKKIISIVLISLLFPAFIFAQEPKDGLLLTGLFTDSTIDRDVLDQGIAKDFNLRTVWTYDRTDIITGPLEALATAKGIAGSSNGLQEPLLSEISGYQKKVIGHSAGTTTAVTLAKEGKLWGDTLYLVSPALISQDELRQIRDLTSQGKGFNKIALYTGDDMIPDFKEITINFSDYTVKVKPAENTEIILTKVVYEDRDRKVDILNRVLNDFVTSAEGQLGKEPSTLSIYGTISGNKSEIVWKDGTIDFSYLQSDLLTGQPFYDEPGIEVIPIFAGFPHGMDQLVILEEFYNKYTRMPGKEDIEYFKQQPTQKIPKEITTAHDPNELIVSPIGDVKPGSKLNYTINYENEGEGIAFGVYITDTIDEDLDDSTITINNSGHYDANTRTITWFIGRLDPKQQGSVGFSINVDPNAKDNLEAINFATVHFPSVPEITLTNGTVNRITTTVDNNPPITTSAIFPLPNNAGWNNANVSIALSATDNAGSLGVAKTEYSFDGINWIDYSNPFTITNEGQTKVYYKSTDNAGNIESAKSLEIEIDKTPPVISAEISPPPNSYNWNDTDVTVSFNASDNLSAVASVTEPITITNEGENQYVGGNALDLAGNAASASVIVNIDKTPPQINITANPGILWPPNHKLVDVNISGSATDTLSGITITSFKVNDEYKVIEPQISGFNTSIQLEAWRNGDDLDGRIYNILVTIKDKANNEASAKAAVICPHDQSSRLFRRSIF